MAKATYFFLLLITLFSCRKKEDAETTENWKIIGTEGEYKYINIDASGDISIPTAKYEYGEGSTGMLKLSQKGETLSEKGRGAGISKLKGSQMYNGAVYTLYEWGTSQDHQYTCENNEQNAYIFLNYQAQLQNYELEQFYLKDDSTIIVLGQSKTGDPDLVVFKLNFDQNNNRLRQVQNYSMSGRQAGLRILPWDDGRMLVIYEDDGNGYQERDIAFMLLDSNLQEVGKSRLALNGYQEMGGILLEDDQLIMSGHTDDLELSHDFFLAKFSRDSLPVLQSINRYGGDKHDGSTAIADGGGYYALLGISSDKGISTTCIKLIDKSSLNLTKDIYLENSHENYPHWAEIKNDIIYVVGYEISTDGKRHTMVLRHDLNK